MSPEQVVIEVGKLLLAAGPKIAELVQHIGGRDAFLAALDTALAVARAKTDADLAAKHRP
jgi:hypothetical protein